MNSAGLMSKNAARRKTSKLVREIGSSLEQQAPERQFRHTSDQSSKSCRSLIVGYSLNCSRLRTGSSFALIGTWVSVGPSYQHLTSGVCWENCLSRRELCVLCVSALKYCEKMNHRRDAEDAEAAQSSCFSNTDTLFNNLLVDCDALFASAWLHHQKHRNQVQTRADQQSLIEAREYRNHQRRD
jgi:hypothetical protein